MNRTATGIRRRFRWPIGLAVLLAVAIVASSLLQGSVRRGELDPAAYDASGSHALAALLADRGVSLERITDPGAASAGSGDLLVITRPYLLAAEQVTELAVTAADMLIVEPDAQIIERLQDALGLPLTITGWAKVDTVVPGCDLTSAVVAGDAELGGAVFEPPPGAVGCYRHGGGAALVSLRVGQRTVTVLGSGTPLMNGHLAHRGNAALALGLTAGYSRVVWLTPGTWAAGVDHPRSLMTLLPRSMKLAALQLAVAMVLIALWRGRRLGPVVDEPMPVKVPSFEVVTGLARLYRRGRGRDAAAAALRAASLARISDTLGLPATAEPELVVSRIVDRTGRSRDAVRALLYGSTPVDDQALVRLASELDTLAHAVLSPEVQPS
jgi:hypothetical protein